MAKQQLRWVPPPNWPQPPAGWAPPPGWQPDPAWGPPPADWVWWQHEEVPGDGQHAKIHKLMQKYGGAWEDVWAVGQAGSGFVRFDGNFLHIQHSGALSRMSVGKGAKRIPVS